MVRLFVARNMLVGAVVVSGLIALSVQFYRRPLETWNAITHAGFRLLKVQEATCTIDTASIHYFYAGMQATGTPIVLIHGLGNSAEVWFALLPLLARNHPVYALDLPGFGQTPLVQEGVTIRVHALYLKHFLNALGLKRVILVGNSLGGWIATLFALHYPEQVEHLYLLNSAGLRREETHSPYAVSRYEAQRTMDNILGYHLPLPPFMLDAVLRVSAMPAYEQFIQKYDVSEELDDVLECIHTPTTIIWGVRDGIFPGACARDFHAHIAGSCLILLNGIGHMPHVQAPIKVAKIILSN